MEKAIKEMSDKKATENDNVSGYVLKLRLGENGLKIMTHPINHIHKTEAWAKDFIEITITTLKKKPKATKCSNCCTISFITNTADTSEDT